MSLEVTGTITQILPLETGEGKNGPWKKQFFVIEYMDGSYAKKVCFSLWGDKTSSLNEVQQGTQVKVSFNIESREYNGRWYTDAKAWRIESMLQGSAGGGSTFVDQGADPVFNENPADENDLPF